MAKNEYGDGRIKAAAKRRPVRVIELLEALGGVVAVLAAQGIIDQQATADLVSWVIGAATVASILLKEIAQAFTTSWLDPMVRPEDVGEAQHDGGHDYAGDHHA